MKRRPMLPISEKLSRAIERVNYRVPPFHVASLEHFSAAQISSLSRRSSDPVPSWVQRLTTCGYSLLLPDDPLAGQPGLPLGLLIPSSLKDASLLPMTVSFAVKACANPIQSVTLVTPEAIAPAVLDHISRDLPCELLVALDSELLPPVVQEKLMCFPSSRRGWLRQQLLKWNGVLESSAPANLVIDADTILVRRRTWVTEQHQLLTPVFENHTAYKSHVTRVWAGELPPLPLSFVAHHQLIQSCALKEMLAELGGPVEGQLAWLSAVDPNEGSGASEYDTYATWMLRRYPSAIAFGRWGNRTTTRRDLLGALAAPGRSLSISAHSYLDT